MRRAIYVISMVLLMAAPARSDDIVRASEPKLGLPDGPYPPEFINWTITDDWKILRKLAGEGDPLAQSHIYAGSKYGTVDYEVLADMRRRGNPAANEIDAVNAVFAFSGGRANADDVRAALHKVETSVDNVPLLLDLLEFEGGRFLPRDDQVFELPAAIGKGNATIDGIACRITVLPWQVDMTLLPACRMQEERGDAEAAWRLGLVSQQRSDDFYEDFIPQLAKALDVQPDLSAALDHYRRAAAGGHAAAQARLAYHAALGRGMVKDTTEAVRLAKASAAQGHPEGMAVLGLLTLKGIGIEADPAAAAALIRKAAERGSLVAQYTLASLLFRGKVVAQDFAEGLAWLRLIRFSKHGDMPADEYGELMVEPWPRTVVIGNMLGRAREVDLETQARAARLRQDLANDGRWPYRSEVVF